MWRQPSRSTCAALLAVCLSAAQTTSDGASHSLRVAQPTSTDFATAPFTGSAQFFEQLFPVFQHPRCMNCHTGEAFPRQGDDRHRHTMNVMRGPADNGAAGLHCTTCHQSTNQAPSGVPGAPDWHLAPARMAWTGLTPSELCRALRDPNRGAMSPNQMLPHFATALIRWGWNPGTNAHGHTRTTPPMSYSEFIGLTKRWIESGATCP